MNRFPRRENRIVVPYMAHMSVLALRTYLRAHIGESIVFFLLLLLYASFLVTRISFPAGADLPRHIMNGEVLLQGEWRVLFYNLYSYTEPLAPFANHHWFFGIIASVLKSTVGFGGIVVVKTIILLSAFALIFAVACKKASFWLVTLLSIPTILVLTERADFRPEIFSYVYVALFLYVLFTALENPKSNRLFFLVPLQIVWVNTHIFFVFGIVLALGFCAERMLHAYPRIGKDALVRKLSVLVILLALVSTLNPHGIRGATLQFDLNIKGESPIGIAEDATVLSYIQEKTYGDDISIALFFPLVALLITSLIFGVRRRQYLLAAASIGSAALAYLHLRGLALFALMFLPAASANLDAPFRSAVEWCERQISPFFVERARRILVGVLCIGLVSVTLFSEKLHIREHRDPGLGLAQWSEESALFFEREHLRGPVFNDADIGSYLIYHLYPEEKVFVDNRFGDAYTSEFFSEMYLPMINDPRVWAVRNMDYAFDTIFLYQYDALANARKFISERMRDPEWALVYADRYVVIFVRETIENQEKIMRLQITKENVEEKIQHLLASHDVHDHVVAADLFGLIERHDLAMRTYLDIVAGNPHLGAVWAHMGTLELLGGSREHTLLGSMYLERAIEEGSGTSDVYSLLGMAYIRLEQVEKGRSILEKALRVNPLRGDIRDFLIKLDTKEGL